MRVRKVAIGVGVAVVALVGLVMAFPGARRHARELYRGVQKQFTVEERLAQYGPAARARLEGHFEKAGVKYPGAEVVLVGIKQTRTLEVWARKDGQGFALVRTYPIVGASGRLGPKLREGDRQVPEGLYEIESLNPNSSFHLSLRVSYPNEFDREQAKRDGRTKLGGDIMIHGGSASVGCLAMGDEAAEDLFTLAADVGLDNVRVILTPVDFRCAKLPADMPKTPAWTADLYAKLREAMEPLRQRGGAGEGKS